MIEKVYKIMGNVGSMNIIAGIIVIVAGVAIGVITIVGGARLLNGKKGLTF